MIQRQPILSILFAASLTLIGCKKEEAAPATGPGANPAPATTPQAQPQTQAQAQASGQSNEGASLVTASGARSLASMIPADTVLWIELESFDALASAFEESVGDALKGQAGPADPEGALMLLQMMGLPVDRLRRDAPIALALSLELGETEPRFSAMVPMDKAEETAKQVTEMNGPAKAKAAGDYVIFSNLNEITADTELAGTFANTRGGGLFGMRADVARLMERYGSIMENALNSASQPPTSRHTYNDYSQGFAAGKDVVMTLANGIKTASMRIDLHEGELTGDMSAVLLSGSKLTELGSDGTANLEDMLAYVDASTNEILVGAVSKQAVQFIGDPLAHLIQAIAKERGYDGIQETYENAMSFIAGESLDFAIAASDMDAAAFIHGVDSSLLLPMIEREIETHVSGMDDLTMLTPRKGADEMSRFAQYDLAANAGTPSVRHFTTAFGRPRLRLRLLGKGNQSMMTIGEGLSLGTSTDEERGELPADLTWALSQIQGANPAMISRTRISGGLAERSMQVLAGHLVPEVPSTPATEDAWTTGFVALGKSEWRAGFRVNFKAMVAQVQNAMDTTSAFAQPR